MRSNYLENVFVHKIKNEKIIINKLEDSNFKRIFSENEINKLVQIYSGGKGFFNGKSVRLDKLIDNDVFACVNLSLINFYDFISTNMVYQNIDKYKNDSLLDNESLELLHRLESVLELKEKPKNIFDIINNEYLSNILAVSILIEDINGNYGIVRRTKNLIGSYYVSTTVTGSLDEVDYDSDNPFLSCAYREIFEELNITNILVELQSIVVSKSQLQPILLFNGKINKSWVEVIDNCKTAIDYKKEIQNFYSVPKNFLESFINDAVLTDAARYHILHSIENIEQQSINKEHWWPQEL